MATAQQGQTPPPSSSSGKSANVKLRSSCDQCSANKTKCSRGAVCQRCQSLQLQCHYSPSNRAGKPPRSKKSLVSSNNSINVPSDIRIAPQASQQSFSSQNFVFPAAERGQNFSSTPSLSSSSSTKNASASLTSDDSAWPDTDVSWLGDLAAVTGPQEINLDSENDDVLGADTMSGLLSCQPTSVPISASDAIEHVDPLSLGHVDLNFASLSSVTSAMIGQSPCGASPQRGSLSHNCSKLALETLQRLYNVPISFQNDCTGDPYPSLDHILRTNSVVLENIDSMLSCSHSEDYYLPLLVAVIAFKALSWYQAVVGIYDPFVELPEGSQCIKETVTDRPLTVGAYELDEKTGRAMKDSLILNNLREMNSIAGRYNTTFCKNTANGNLASGGQLYSIMGNVLRLRVQHTIQELEKRLAHPGTMVRSA